MGLSQVRPGSLPSQPRAILLRVAVVNRTYGTHKNLHVHPFLQTVQVLFTMVPRNTQHRFAFFYNAVSTPTSVTRSTIEVAHFHQKYRLTDRAP